MSELYGCGNLTLDEILKLSTEILYSNNYKYLVVKTEPYGIVNYKIFKLNASRARLHFEKLKTNKSLCLIISYDIDKYDYSSDEVCTVFEYNDGILRWINPVFKTLIEAENYKEKMDKNLLIKNVIE